MNENDITLQYLKFDNSHYMVIIKKGKRNISIDFGIYDFEGEMEYLGYTTSIKKLNDNVGFIFENLVDKNDVANEIKRLVKRYGI